MPILSARHLHKSYGPRVLLAGASVTIGHGDRVGLVGTNGSGKSTLLRIMAGLEPADAGVIERGRGDTMGYLAQEPVLDPQATPRSIVLSGLGEWHSAYERYREVSHRLEGIGSVDPARNENSAIGLAATEQATLLAEQAHLAATIERLGGWQREHAAHEMLVRFGVRDLDRPVGTMSGGERRRVALARLLVSEPALAILDEPTNHLDADTIEWLEDYLANSYMGAILLVTHDRYVLDAVAERVLELEAGQLFEYEGGYTSYLERKAERLAHAERVEQNRLNLLRRERAWLERGAKARTTKQKARIARAEALLEAEPNRTPETLSLSGLETGRPQLGRTIVELDSVGLDVGHRTLVHDLTLHLVEGDRVGIVGPNGAGKTSLLRLVAGELAPTSGRVTRGQRTVLAYFDQARTRLVDEWSVFDNVAEQEGAERTGGGVVTLGKHTVSLRAYLERFLFDAGAQRKKVGALSGGERARVALALVLKSGANLLLLDEPTNDLDVTTLGALEELLITWPGCVLVVSHDRYFLDRVATSVLAFESDGKVVRHAGGYSAYRAVRETRSAAGGAAAATTTPARTPSTTPATAATSTTTPTPAAKQGPRGASHDALKAKPLTYAERIELDGLLDRIDAAERRKATAEAALGDPALYSRSPDDVRRANDERQTAHEEVERLMARWEELARRREASSKD